jgi:hypothetical protein
MTRPVPSPAFWLPGLFPKADRTGGGEANLGTIGFESRVQDATHIADVIPVGGSLPLPRKRHSLQTKKKLTLKNEGVP